MLVLHINTHISQVLRSIGKGRRPGIYPGYFQSKKIEPKCLLCCSIPCLLLELHAPSDMNAHECLVTALVHEIPGAPQENHTARYSPQWPIKQSFSF